MDVDYKIAAQLTDVEFVAKLSNGLHHLAFVYTKKGEASVVDSIDEALKYFGAASAATVAADFLTDYMNTLLK